MTDATNPRNPYWPLIILILVSVFAGTASTYGDFGGNVHIWMHNVMGYFLCMFALLKLFDPVGFAKGFAKYDLLAGRSRVYGLIYPWLELFLGLAYLALIVPGVVYSATILLFGFGMIGVVVALRNGLNINCPCMGTILRVPLSTVTLTENLAMIVMAIAMLAQIL